MRWIALFGEAEKGTFGEGVEVHTSIELLRLFGHPPKDARGMTLGIQALHYHQHPLLFFRVKDEGYSLTDYRRGLLWLDEKLINSEISLSALFAPGVGSLEIIDPLIEFSLRSKALFITTEQDFFDFITSR